MARIARIVVPGIPHHIVQRGNRSQQVFFSDKDKETYLDILHQKSKEYRFKIIVYCLMDNHVHLIVIPENENSLAKGIGETHKNYTRMINFRNHWRGYLWQGRFASFPLHQSYLLAAIRYVEMNPVRAGLVENPEQYIWSSARYHVLGEESKLISDHSDIIQTSELRSFIKDYKKEDAAVFRKFSKTGRPLGEKDFIDELEKMTGRVIHQKKPGPKK